MNTTGNVDVVPNQLEKPDGKYREKSCFTISKKELREFTRKGSIPERISNYKKETKEDPIYMKHGTHLVFRVPGDNS
jgi:hypothetical protein